MKKVLITWASDWLGLALAKLLVADGVEVVNISRRKPPIDITHIQCNFTCEEDVNLSIRLIGSSFSDFDTLIHCAWITQFHSDNEINYADMQKIFATNVIGISVLTSWLIDLIKRNGSDLLFTASTIGFKSVKEQAAYGSTKRAIRSMAKYFQDELKNATSRVVSFCPWGLQTNFYEKFETGRVDTSQYMPVEWVALCMKQILELPKYMEVSEIVINRKVASI